MIRMNGKFSRILTIPTKHGTSQTFPLRRSILGYVTWLDFGGKRYAFHFNRQTLEGKPAWACHRIGGIEPLAIKPTIAQALAFAWWHATMSDVFAAPLADPTKTIAENCGIA